MPSERIQRRTEGLLDEADEALRRNDWQAVVECAAAVLALDPGNEDAKHYRDAAERGLAVSAADARPEASSQRATTSSVPSSTGRAENQAVVDRQPSSFANGRYTVKKFLGEGGKKKVYLAHDTTLDRDVAFALIKSEVDTLSKATAGSFLAALSRDAQEARACYSAAKSVASDTRFLWNLLVSVDRGLALAAMTYGDHATSRQHFEGAVQFLRSAGYRADLAWTLHDYSRLLSELGERERAAQLSNEALSLARQMGMKPLIEKIISGRRILRA